MVPFDMLRCGLLFVAMCVCVPGNATASPWSGGAQADVGVSDLAGPDAASGSAGLTGGLAAFGQIRLHERIHLRVEPGMFQHRIGDVHATGLRLPLILRVCWMGWPERRAYAGAGATASWIFSASESDGEGGRDDAVEHIQRADYYLLGALGMEIAGSNRTWHVELRVAQGLRMLDPDPPQLEARVRTYTLVIGAAW